MTKPPSPFRWYILKDKVPIRAESLEEAGAARMAEDGIVAKTPFPGGEVSTIFLFLDHAYGGGPPLLFETMVFGGEHNGLCQRCSTWAEAEEQHMDVCELVGAYNAEVD